MNIINYKDFSILIQGPLNINSINNIDNYLQYCQYVVVSYWSENIDKMIENKLLDKANTNNNIIIVKKNTPIITTNIDNNGNQYLQTMSILNGMEKINTKYCIKTRSDESYSNLSKIIDIFLQDDRKILTNDLFFRKDIGYKYHMSDHVIIAKSDVLQNGFFIAKKYCEKLISFPLLQNNTTIKSNPLLKVLVPEQIFTYSLLLYILHKYNDNILLNYGNSKLIMQKYFMICSISLYDWGDIIWTINHKQKISNTNTNWLVMFPLDISTIATRIEEL